MMSVYQNSGPTSQPGQLPAHEREKLERLRDEFAMAALTGLITKYGISASQLEQASQQAYMIADEMMKAREQSK